MCLLDRRRAENKTGLAIFADDPSRPSDVEESNRWAESLENLLRAFLQVNEVHHSPKYDEHVMNLALMVTIDAKDRGQKFANWDEINAYLAEKFPGINWEIN